MTKTVKPRKVPERMCLGCQAMKPKRELIRIVRSPEGEISVDPTGKKAGRGAYICPNEECLTKGIKEKRLEHALQTAISAETVERLRQELMQHE